MAQADGGIAAHRIGELDKSLEFAGDNESAGTASLAVHDIMSVLYRISFLTGLSGLAGSCFSRLGGGVGCERNSVTRRDFAVISLRKAFHRAARAC